MTHSHYVLDLYFLTNPSPDQFRREVLRIEAGSDDEAETEARRIGRWKAPDYFLVRAIANATRGGGRIVFDSRSLPAAEVEDPSVIVLPR